MPGRPPLSKGELQVARVVCDLGEATVQDLMRHRALKAAGR